MHTALRIPEVLRYICEYADEDSLIAMAQTARVLHEPAVEMVWYHLPNLVPLFQCFPEDTWVLEDERSFVSPAFFVSSSANAHFKRTRLVEQVFTRVVTPKDWTAVLRYASLVRHLGAEESGYTWTVSETAWTTICSLRPTQILFPHLRSISWYAPELLPGEHLPSLLTCVGRNLVEIELETYSPWHDDRRTLEASFGIIAERFPVLQRFHIGENTSTFGECDTPELVNAVSALACGFTSLVSFSSTYLLLTPAALLSLIQAKTLRCLDVHLPNDMTWLSERLSSCYDATVTLQLEEVGLHSTPEAYIAFSKVVALPHATGLNLLLYNPPPYPLLEDVFSSIRRQCSPDALRTLTVHDIGEDFDSLRNADILLPHHLRPLLAFKRLKFLQLDLFFRYALDDTFCVDMARAWPCMVYLYIDCSLPGDVLPSVRVLPLFAAHFPKLEHLKLVFDATCWDDEALFNADHTQGDIYGPLANRASTSPLFRLWTGPSPVLGPRFVAAFLARIFPNLKVIKNSGRGSKWEEVEQLLPLFQSARLDGRLRMAQELAENLNESQTVPAGDQALGFNR